MRDWTGTKKRPLQLLWAGALGCGRGSCSAPVHDLLEGLAKIVHVVDQIRESGINNRAKIEGILMTMYDGRTNLSRKVVQEVKNYFPEWLYRSVIPRTVRLGEAPSHGQTIFEWDPHGTGAEAYDAAAKEFIRRHRRAG